MSLWCLQFSKKQTKTIRLEFFLFVFLKNWRYQKTFRNLFTFRVGKYRECTLGNLVQNGSLHQVALRQAMNLCIHLHRSIERLRNHENFDNCSIICCLPHTSLIPKFKIFGNVLTNQVVLKRNCNKMIVRLFLIV